VRTVCASAYRPGGWTRVGLHRSMAQRSAGEIAMRRDWIEDGWRRFLDRLKDFWGKPELTTA